MEDLGVDVTLKAYTSTQLNDIIFSTGAWDSGWIPLSISLPSQSVPFASGTAPPNGTNFGHIVNSQYTASAGKAAVAADVATPPVVGASREGLYRNFDLVQMYDLCLGISEEHPSQLRGRGPCRLLVVV